MKVINTNKTKPGINNYLLLQPQTPITPGAYTSAKFIFGDYKTAKSYGVQRFDVPHKLFEQLLPIAKDRIGASLFYNERTKEKLAQSTFSERMSDAVKAKVDPDFKKNAGPTVFRHSYITHFLESNPPTKKRKEIAKQMAHTIGMQLLYDERERSTLPGARVGGCPGRRGGAGVAGRAHKELTDTRVRCARVCCVARVLGVVRAARRAAARVRCRAVPCARWVRS
jgi:hypothetical protein